MVKRINKVYQALNLPKVLNVNPRSIYNKLNEFVTFVDEEQIDLVCMSESWERENLTLENVIDIDFYPFNFYFMGINGVIYALL